MTQICNGTQSGGGGRPRRETVARDLSSATKLSCDLIQTIILPDGLYHIPDIKADIPEQSFSKLGMGWSPGPYPRASDSVNLYGA